MQRNVWLMAISVIAALILVNNTVYYFLTKKTLEDGHKQEMLRLAKQIELSVEQTRKGAEFYEEQIGRELRTASIAAQYALDPDIEKVTSDQLQELSEKLDIAHISLLKRTEDDIVLYQSSDPTQPGTSTKNWKPWYEIFQQLFNQDEVSSNWLGQKMANFWSGPFETSSTDKQKIYKWGYYYDGTTNYMIDPYVDFKSSQETYMQIAGVERLLTDLVDKDESLLEIAVFNPRTFPEGIQSTDREGDTKEHIVQRSLLFGTYGIKSDSDVKFVQQAYHSNTIVTNTDKVDGRQIYKMFIPVSMSDRDISVVDELGNPLNNYVLTIISDYGIIQEKLNKQFLNLGLIITLLTLASLIIAIIAMRYAKQSRDKAVAVTQETYAEEINSLFHSIRAQRHDFINHVQTIHSLAELNKHKELVAYTKELTGEIKVMNDIINIGNPAIAALIRSKISQAEGHRIHFQCRFNGLRLQGMGGKTLDINRILGNLIDNAFDEVLKYGEEERNVLLVGNQTEHSLEFMVTNACHQAEEQAAKPLFEAGYSTKQNQHQGLGLAIVKGIVERYKGEAAVVAEGQDQLTVIVRLPL
ncbi:GHKL domain-containing protein [Paenibacillus sp. 1011MAR3C5]|uniref:sensor histidine kinase n=1 Tax=Paenibacillus sp. 1011MAR3C5 TaxID=1675787 RepID=UPI000E6B81E4|nr:GHKL domain-containing protein [Paenibacillus sp. 1011MAR3C5]RJE84676.1 GHKL domain-containing protein [Paenibacillus sp. 1011MAR3C5]